MPGRPWFRMRRVRPEGYTVGWVCALPLELEAATDFLDEVHQDIDQDAGHPNLYTLGSICEHNVVIICLPAGQTGTNSAAAAVGQMKQRFPSLQYFLLVGVGGGVPSTDADIRLGDVVVSQPNRECGGVIQYDLGKYTPSGFVRTGSLNSPPTILLSALSKLQANKSLYRTNLSKSLAAYSHLRDNVGSDVLFESTYEHVDGSMCEWCSKDKLVYRPPRVDQDIKVHYGTIASGNQVIRDGVGRDKLSLELGCVLCFEMEAAGLMNSFPCLVIRGICDYADSHKNKTWQPYAATTATAFARQLLSIIPAPKVVRTTTTIETDGSVDNVIGALGNTIRFIRELGNGWKSDFAAMNLIAQLTALRAALAEIKAWTDTITDDPYHQLVMDLEVGVSCCRILIDKMDTMLGELHQAGDTPSDLDREISRAFDSENIDGLRKMIKRQTSALTLLLTACNSKTLSEQKALLQKSSTRKTLKLVEHDSASLVVLRDSASQCSRGSDNLSKLSVEFQFDHEIFGSKVYERCLRGFVKQTLRQQQPRSGLVQSQVVHHRLEQDEKQTMSEIKVLLLGSPDCGKDAFLLNFRILQQCGLSIDELATYRALIYENVIDRAKALVEAMKRYEIRPELEDNQKYCDFLMEYPGINDSQTSMEAEVGVAISSIWCDPCIPKIMEYQNEICLMDSAAYFFREIERISAPGYIPNEADVIRARQKASGIRETRFSMEQTSITFVDVGLQLKEYIHQYEGMTLIFVVDLSSYNQAEMIKTMALFDFVVNSRRFMTSRVVLIFNKIDAFHVKLALFPLKNYFLEYSGGSDVSRAATFISWRFKLLNRAHLSVYTYWVQCADKSSMRVVFASIKETILKDALG